MTSVDLPSVERVSCQTHLPFRRLGATDIDQFTSDLANPTSSEIHVRICLTSSNAKFPLFLTFSIGMLFLSQKNSHTRNSSQPRYTPALRRLKVSCHKEDHAWKRTHYLAVSTIFNSSQSEYFATAKHVQQQYRSHLISSIKDNL